jgi:hypothetical protein
VGQIERVFENPFLFESNIAYVDFESGYQSKSRSDLLIWIVLPYLIILLSQLSFRKLYSCWFSQKEKLLILAKTLVNILSAELKANLDVAQYGLGLKKLETWDKNLAKTLQ